MRIINKNKLSIPVLGKLENFDDILLSNKIDEIIFALPQGSDINIHKYLNKCEKIGVAVRVVPAMFDHSCPSLKVENIQHIPTLSYFSNAKFTASGLLYKRILDLVGGTIGFFIFCILYGSINNSCIHRLSNNKNNINI